jgi:hypothetical protein
VIFNVGGRISIFIVSIRALLVLIFLGNVDGDGWSWWCWWRLEYWIEPEGLKMIWVMPQKKIIIVW